MGRLFISFFVTGIILLFEGRKCMADNLPIERVIDPAPFATYNPCADIRNGQFVCVDCSTLAFCIQEGGSWITVEYETCRTDKSLFCDEDARGCTIQRECFLPKRGIKFECQNPGMYPDPYDCKSYHNCNNFNEDTRYICPPGLAYSVEKKDCTLTTANSDACKKPQYSCNKSGQMGSWPGDENIYYICHVKALDGSLVYYPVLYRCQPGKVFDGEKCTSSASITPKPDLKCTEGKLTPNPNDCRGYYQCKNGILIEKQCTPGFIFNAKTSYCDFGNC